MEPQREFSHGLLYSVPPQCLFSLHLKEENDPDEFEWEGRKPGLFGKSFAQKILSLLKKAVPAAGHD